MTKRTDVDPFIAISERIPPETWEAAGEALAVGLGLAVMAAVAMYFARAVRRR